MTVIDTAQDVVTRINVFTVDPARQGELVELLDRATVETMVRRPGFVSANIHRSLDGTQVTNYAQWDSEADLVAMQGDPDCRVHMEQAAAMAAFAPQLYRVASTHGRSAEATVS